MRIRQALYFILVLLLVSCAAPKTPQSVTDTFVGNWTLKSMMGEPLPALKKPVTLNIEETENRISGYAGCNSYFTTYTNQGAAIKFSAIGSTKMFCSEGMAVEDKFILTLAGVDSFEIESQTLFLLENNKVVLEFTR